ncbi:MAG: NADH-quinone oxidoreductase subunit L [Alphaproteobacteria bacterium]
MYTATVFLPLLGSVIAGLFGRVVGDRGAQLVTCGFLCLSAVLSLFIFNDVILNGNIRDVPLFTWINSGGLDAAWSLRFDVLTAVMVFVVTVVSAAVHVYSIGYMEHDPGIPRFFSYLSLFTFFMLMLVTASNLLQLFFGWEGVGLCSYLLIGFWYDRPSANAAAIKAFVVNRVGDFGFMLGILYLYLLFGSINYDVIFANVGAMDGQTVALMGRPVPVLEIVCLLLFVGAMGKSAQIGLHTWLPDAMEGPTPVSALIHAATMVTAGVFMVARLSPVFEHAPAALAVITVVGATTAFFGATVGLCQNDIKRVVAYSTVSQLGYMFFAIGVSAYAAAIFHLMTHAFFKALLFLGAGSVIHAMSGEQDMRRMGGIWKAVPLTYGLMWIGSLALAGVPFFAGYFSKDIIIESAFAAGGLVGRYAYVMGIAAAFMTAFYSWRLLYMTFHGAPRADEHVMAHVHESPKVMTIPLIVLALGSLFAGLLGYDSFVGDGMKIFWSGSITVAAGHESIEAAHHIPETIKLTPTVLALAGIALATVFYVFMTGLPGFIARRFRPLYLFLLNKWYFDEAYDRVFVQPALYLGAGLWKSGDGALIDGVGPDGVAAATRSLARRASRLQTGYVYHYAFAMLIGVVALVTWYLYTLGR